MTSLGQRSFTHRSVAALSCTAVLLLASCRASLAGGGAGESTTETPGAPGSEVLPGVPACTEGELPPEAPELARLIDPEYRATLASLFPGISLDGITLPPDVSLAGYLERAAAHKPSSSFVAALDANGRRISERVTADLTGVTGCEETDADCLASYLEELAVRAFRSEADTPAATSIVEFFRAQAATFGLRDALGLTIEVVLQAPEFVYKIERGVPDDATGRRRLTGRELAAKLSYLLWDGPPDDALLADADAGRLTSEEGLTAAVERMLESDAARPAITAYFRQWLRGDKFFRQLEEKDAATFPDYSPEVAASLAGGLERFLEDTFFEGTVADLFGSSHAFVDARSAPIYGLSEGSPELTRVELDPAERRGLFGQAGFLAGTSHQSLEAPIQRGVFVLERVLCAPAPPPPPGVVLELPMFDPSEPRTLREVIEDVHAVGSCRGCHSLIDGVGFTLNNYDAIGRFQTEQYGLPIDPSGNLRAGTDVDGVVENGVELATRLADSEQVKLCMTKEFLAHALGRSLTDADACSIPDASSRIDERNGRMRALASAAAKSLAFRTRAEF